MKVSTQKFEGSDNAPTISCHKDTASNDTKVAKPVYTMMYDCTLRKPGCVLLQVLGTLPRQLFWEYFGDSNCWLVHPTPDMKLYEVTEDMLPLIRDRTDFTR